MVIITCILVLLSILQTYVTMIEILRKDSLFKIFINLVFLIFMIVIGLYDIDYSFYGVFNSLSFVLSIVICVLVVINFMFFFNNRNVSILSIKSGIDMSSSGIMFLNDKKILLINSVMDSILSDLGIYNNYIDNLKKNCFKSCLFKSLDRVWLLRIVNDKEVVCFDVTDIYFIQEEIEIKNKKIEKYNKKILSNLNNIERIEKTKNLIKIKNEFHDLLGYRLSLFNQYLMSDNVLFDEVSLMFDDLFIDRKYDDFNEALDDFVSKYKTYSINVNVTGLLPRDREKSLVLFEIIRESVTNAINHADSKNINVFINDSSFYYEMIISNDGKKPKKKIVEGEGIRGMKRKVYSLGGIIDISSRDGFVLKVRIKK